jgi:hypothetical protein
VLAAVPLAKPSFAVSGTPAVLTMHHAAIGLAGNTERPQWRVSGQQR